MNAVDGVLLCILLLSAVVGMWRGLVYEVLSVATWVVAFVLAQAYAGRAAAVLPLGEMAAGLRTAIGFAAVFIGCAFAGGMLAWLVKRMVSAVGLRPIDRVLGTAFGCWRWRW
jgi:membrane protein required for colicin V production